MGEVYYKFKCEKKYYSATFDGHLISVGNLKRIILGSKRMGKPSKVMHLDLLISNAQIQEEYVDEGELIPSHTSVLIHRVPLVRRPPILVPAAKVPHTPIVTNAPPPLSTQDEEHHHHRHTDDFDDFGDDVFAIPAPPTTSKEDMKIIKGQSQSSDGHERGPKTPPQGYICHRCNLPGHFIHHCPTNGDPNFDRILESKRREISPAIKSQSHCPTNLDIGIPKSMLADAILPKPNEEDFFEKESQYSVVADHLPRCPCCKQIMKDAVFTSKCCFKSFCNTCIRDHINSKSMCVCGATNIVADHLLPNPTIRETVDRILGSQKRKRHDQDEKPEISGCALFAQVQDKKKKKKICNAKNYMMPFAPNPYWRGIPSYIM